MGASSSVQPSGTEAPQGQGSADPRSTPAAGVDTTDINSTRSELTSLSISIAHSRAAGISEELTKAVDAAVAGLEAAGTFTTDAPKLRSITAFEKGYEATLDRVAEVTRGLPNAVLDLLTAEEKTRITQEFAPLTMYAAEVTKNVRRERGELQKTVLENQETDYVRSGLRAIEERVAHNLDLVLQKRVGMFEDIRVQVLEYFKDNFVRPYVASIEAQPLTGELHSAALDTSMNQLQKEKQFEIAPGQKILLSKGMGNPEILQAFVDAKDHLTFAAREFTRSSVLSRNGHPDLKDLMRSRDMALDSGLRAKIDYTWAPEAKDESCQIRLQSPFGDRASYRFDLKPRSGAEEDFRLTVVKLLNDIKALSQKPSSEDLAQRIVRQLHELGGDPIVETAPLRDVAGLLHPTDTSRKLLSSSREILEAVTQTLQQRFTFTPMTFGTEGHDSFRVNTLGLEIDRGKAVVKLHREGYNGKEFDDTPSIVLVASSSIEAQRAVSTVIDLLKESRGDLESAAGRNALKRLLHAEREYHSGATTRSIFEVKKLTNASLSGLKDVDLRLAPDGTVSNTVFRGCSVRISNPTESDPKTVLSDVRTDAESGITFNLTGARLERVTVGRGHLNCRECTATDMAISELSPESKRAWEENGNRLRGSRIVEPYSSIFGRLFSGADPMYRMVSRSPGQ